MHQRISPAPDCNSRGFSLVEVLIAVFVIGIGLLGMAQMQLLSIRDNSSAYSRSRAVMLVNDILERMRANPTAAFADHNDDNQYHYNVDFNLGDTPPTASNCIDANCARPKDVAAADLAEWLKKVEELLPEGEAEVDCLGNTCTITLNWIEPANPYRQDQNDSITVTTRL